MSNLAFLHQDEESPVLPNIDAELQARLAEPEFAEAVQLLLDKNKVKQYREELLAELTENERLFVELRQAEATMAGAKALVDDLKAQVRAKLKDGEAVGFDVKRYDLIKKRSGFYDTARMIEDGKLTAAELESYRKPNYTEMRMVSR